MNAAQAVYRHVPVEVTRVGVYAWQAGRAPVPLAVPTAREDGQILVALPASQSVIVLMHRRDDAYLVDGPLVVSADAGDPNAIVERTIAPIWRHTIAGPADRPPAPPPLDWLTADGTAGSGWPSCWWDAVGWDCMGVPLATAGVVVGLDGSRLLAAVVAGGSTPVLRASMWGRLVRVGDRGSGSPPRLRLTAARPVASPSRLKALRLETATLADVRVRRVSPGVYWVAGDSSPPDAWLEIRSDRSGPLFLSIADIAQGPAQLPMQVVLEDRRDISVAVISDRGDPARGALVTAFRLIDPEAAALAREQRPPRRVLAADATAGTDGVAEIGGLGEADYEIVAWHPQFGRAGARLMPGATRLTIHLRSPGIVRGRVVVDGTPAPGVAVVSVPDPAAYVNAADPLDLKGGDARTTPDGRFAVAIAPSGGGELRVGGGAYRIVRVPLPHGALPLVELGDIELGRPLTITVTLDQDPGCDLRATGPVGRSGLQIVAATRTGPGLFAITLPEEGSWEFVLLCGRVERALAPAVVTISTRDGPHDVRLTVR